MSRSVRNISALRPAPSPVARDAQRRSAAFRAAQGAAQWAAYTRRCICAYTAYAAYAAYSAYAASALDKPDKLRMVSPAGSAPIAPISVA